MSDVALSPSTNGTEPQGGSSTFPRYPTQRVTNEIVGTFLSPPQTFMEAIQLLGKTQEGATNAPSDSPPSPRPANIAVKQEERVNDLLSPAVEARKDGTPLSLPPSSTPSFCTDNSCATPHPFSVSWMHSLAVRWQRAAAHHPDGLGVGCVVFAPKPIRRGSTGCAAIDLPQYALAEITGIQSADATVTVSFLFSSPGADEEEISIFDVIPSTEVWKDGCTRHGDAKNNAHCASLLERLLRLPLHTGPLPEEYLYHQVIGGNAGVSCGTASPLSPLLPLLRCLYGERDGVAKEERSYRCTQEINEQSKCTKKAPHSSPPTVPVMSEAPRLVPSGQLWCFSYKSSKSIHQCYAEAFKTLDQAIARDYWALTDGHPPVRSESPNHSDPKSSPPTVLCVFDEFSLLQRFEVFMSTRGHTINMLDGGTSISSEIGVSRVLFSSPAEEFETSRVRKRKRSWDLSDDGNNVCKAPRPKVTHYAFKNPCKVWFCMLMDDLDPPEGVSALLENAPTIDYLFFVSSEREGQEVSEMSGGLTQNKLQEHLKNTLSPFLLHYSSVMFVGFPFPSASASPHVSPSALDVENQKKQATPLNTVKISGQIFEGRKIMVPPSPEQLLLLATVTSFQETNQGTNLEAEFQGEKKKTSIGAALSERIALGTFTNLSADHLFSSYSTLKAKIYSGVDKEKIHFSSIEELHHNFCVDPSSFFGNSFPVYAIAKCIAQDTYTTSFKRASANETTCLSFVPPRIALVLPRGNPSGNSHSSSKFVSSLKEYFSAWSVYEVSRGSSSERIHQGSRWNSKGGVLLVYCDETESQMSTIHMEADIVIACGKRAATWTAATIVESVSAPPCYAVISEIEVVSNCEDHTWTPYHPHHSNHSYSIVQSTEMETLWEHLVQFFSSPPEGRSRISISKVLQYSISLWLCLENQSCLRGIAKGIALSVATTPFLRLRELSLSESR